MGLNVKKGSFTLSSGDSGQKQIRSVGFQPTIVIFWATNAGAEDTWISDAVLDFGVMTATEQWSVGLFDEGTSGLDSECASHHSTTSVLRQIADGSGTFDFDLTPGSTRFDPDGFDLTVTDAPAADKVIHWEALAGSDITGVELGKFTAGGASVGSNTDVTVAASWGKPDFLILACSPINSTTDPTSTTGLGGISLGFAVSDTERASIGYFQNDAESTIDTGTYLAARALHQFRDTTAPSMERAWDLAARANWPTDGFRLTVTEISGTPDANHLIFYIALKGTFNKKIGLADSPTSNSDQDLDAGFIPALTMFASDALPAHASIDITHADGHGLGLGAYDSTTQGLVRMQQDDGNSQAILGRSITDTSAVQRLTGPASTPTNLGVAVASYPSGNTVRLAWTGVGATARQFLWVALGSTPAAFVPRHSAVNHQNPALV